MPRNATSISDQPFADSFLTQEAYDWWVTPIDGAYPPRQYLPEFVTIRGERVNMGRAYAYALQRPLELTELQTLVYPDPADFDGECAITGESFTPVAWIEPRMNWQLMRKVCTDGTDDLSGLINWFFRQGKLLIFGAYYFRKSGDELSDVFAVSGSPYFYNKHDQEIYVSRSGKSPLVATKHKHPHKYWGVAADEVHARRQAALERRNRLQQARKADRQMKDRAAQLFDS